MVSSVNVCKLIREEIIKKKTYHDHWPYDNCEVKLTNLVFWYSRTITISVMANALESMSNEMY